MCYSQDTISDPVFDRDSIFPAFSQLKYGWASKCRLSQAGNAIWRPGLAPYFGAAGRRISPRNWRKNDRKEQFPGSPGNRGNPGNPGNSGNPGNPHFAATLRDLKALAREKVAEA